MLKIKWKYYAEAILNIVGQEIYKDIDTAKRIVPIFFIIMG